MSKKKLAKPLNPLIYATARDFAAQWFEVALSSGLKDTKYGKNPRRFAIANIEKFIPFAIKTLIDMLSPTSNCNDTMREAIYHALIDPLNDPELMDMKAKPLDSGQEMLKKAIANFDKNKIKFGISSEPISKKDLKSSTALG